MQSVLLDLEVLKNLAITPHEYILCYLLYNQESIGDYLNITKEFKDEVVKKAVKSGLILNLSSDVEFKVILTQAGKDLFISKADPFLEIFNLYPMKVPDGKGGYRLLRAKDPDTLKGKECKIKYNKIVKNNLPLHQKIVKALETQLAMNKHSLQYLQQFEVWLNQRTFETFYDVGDTGTDQLI